MNFQITTKRLECNVIEYILTLMPNRPQNNITDMQQIISSSNNGHNINDLLPGYQYNIKLTPITSNGPLKPSSIFTFTTLRNGKYLFMIFIFKILRLQQHLPSTYYDYTFILQVYV